MTKFLTLVFVIYHQPFHDKRHIFSDARIFSVWIKFYKCAWWHTLFGRLFQVALLAFALQTRVCRYWSTNIWLMIPLHIITSSRWYLTELTEGACYAQNSTEKSLEINSMPPGLDSIIVLYSRLKPIFKGDTYSNSGLSEVMMMKILR